MIKLLQDIWARLSKIFFPKDYYAWQTLIYLGIFSFTLSWVARLATDSDLVVNIIATGGWLFFALGIGWLIDERKIRLFGISIAPWVMGAILCLYLFSLVPEAPASAGFILWPLLSVAIAAIPYLLTWDLNLKTPKPPERQKLILLTLVALLFCSWFQFYFTLQDWFEGYPSLLADDFSQSGFVYRLADASEEQAKGVVLLSSAEAEITDALNDTPWPYVERWLLGLDERLSSIETKTISTLSVPKESDLWQLQADRDELENGSYQLNLMAIWSGPASTEDGYYLTKPCEVQPRSPAPVPGNPEDPNAPTTAMAKVQCELATSKHAGQPSLS